MSRGASNRPVPSDRTGQPLDRSDVHTALASARRRQLLDALETTSVPVDRDRLATLVAERQDAPVTRVKISLVHVHLPLLADRGILTYDRETGLVTDVEDVSRGS